MILWNANNCILGVCRCIEISYFTEGMVIVGFLYIMFIIFDQIMLQILQRLGVSDITSVRLKFTTFAAYRDVPINCYQSRRGIMTDILITISVPCSSFDHDVNIFLSGNDRQYLNRMKLTNE